MSSATKILIDFGTRSNWAEHPPTDAGAKKCPGMARGNGQTMTSMQSPNGGVWILRNGVVEAHSTGYSGGTSGNVPYMSVR